MKIYLALGGGGYRPYERLNCYDFYALDSYLYIKNKKNEGKKFKDYILDSGIFSYLNGKKGEIDWEKYAIEYGDYVRNNNIKNYVEIDVDRFIGCSEVNKLRKKLEKRVGWQSMPVWHINRNYDEWIKLTQEYDYICFGAFITDGLKTDKYYYIQKFLSDARKNNCKVHGLGFTSFEWLKKLKFYSVDSSSWIAGCRFGFINQFQRDKIIQLKQKNKLISDRVKLEQHNFLEWIKYTKYADKYL